MIQKMICRWLNFANGKGRFQCRVQRIQTMICRWLPSAHSLHKKIGPRVDKKLARLHRGNNGELQMMTYAESSRERFAVRRVRRRQYG